MVVTSANTKVYLALGNTDMRRAVNGLSVMVEGQLELDPTLIPRGKGFLFIPAMTSPLNEPGYQVYRGNAEVASASPGTGVLLSPGYYRVLIGSGSVAQMMSRHSGTFNVPAGVPTSPWAVPLHYVTGVGYPQREVLWVSLVEIDLYAFACFEIFQCITGKAAVGREFGNVVVDTAVYFVGETISD